MKVYFGFISLAFGTSLLTQASVTPGDQPWVTFIGGILIIFGALLLNIAFDSLKSD